MENAKGECRQPGEPFALDFYQFNDNITLCIPHLIISYLEEKLKIPWVRYFSNEIKNINS